MGELRLIHQQSSWYRIEMAVTNMQTRSNQNLRSRESKREEKFA